MTVPIQIRNKRVVEEIHQLAALQCKTIAEVVAEAVTARLEEVRQRRVAATKRRICAIQKSIRKLPILSAPLTDADLYDEDGLPH